jgi:hypothetical protein
MKQKHLEDEVGSKTILNLLRKETTHSCSIKMLQRIAVALKVKTIDLVEDWSEE